MFRNVLNQNNNPLSLEAILKLRYIESWGEIFFRHQVIGNLMYISGNLEGNVPTHSKTHA